jgi:hypothetical protein
MRRVLLQLGSYSRARGWRAYLLPELVSEEDTRSVIYCPECAAYEFETARPATGELERGRGYSGRACAEADAMPLRRGLRLH